MTLSTTFYDGLSRTPAYELAITGHLELLERGRAENVVAVLWDHKAVVGFVDGLPVGVITFQHTAWMKQIDIAIGYVRPEFRRRGLYRAMWAALVEKAQELKAEVIFGGTAIDNAELRATAKALGRVEMAVVLKFTVPPPKP